jgi:hypothetical protein
MAGERLSWQPVARLTSERGQQVFEGIARVGDGLYQRSLRLPASKSGLIILDSNALAAGSDAELLMVESDQEGVMAWIIDQAAPEVDEDTRKFGWLLDNSATVASHDHGDWSSELVAHAAGSAMFSELPLPCFLENAYERANARTLAHPGSVDLIHLVDKLTSETYRHAGETDLAYNASRVLSGGYAHDLAPPGDSVATDDLGDARALTYLIGQDRPYNLGADLDDLRFWIAWHMEDVTKLSLDYDHSFVRFGCYPYTKKLHQRSSIPVTTYNTSEAIWALTDRNLCFNCDNGAGFMGLWRDAGFKAQLDAVDAMVDGYQITELEKKADMDPLEANAYTIVDEPILNALDYGLWSRITNIHVRLGAIVGRAFLDRNTLSNIWFGPRPGRRFYLRPGMLLTATNIWSTGSKPAIGIQNYTGVPANVRAVFARK